MNVWQKALLTYVSIYVMAIPMHLPDPTVIKMALLTALGIFYIEGGFSEIYGWIKTIVGRSK